MQCSYAILSSLSCPAIKQFSKLPQTACFSKKIVENKRLVLIFSTTAVWKSSHSTKIWAMIWSKMLISLHLKYPLFLSEFNDSWNFLNKFSKNPQISNPTKIRPVGAELFHADGRTYGQTDGQRDGRSRFFNFAKALKKWAILVRIYSKKNETI